MHPIKRPFCVVTLLGALLASLPAATFAQVTPYGSGINPPDSLVLLSGVPLPGGTFTLGAQNTALAAAPPALVRLTIASAPDPSYPAGTPLAGFGLAGPTAPGELLLSLLPPDPLFSSAFVPWLGGGAPPATFTFSLPASPALAGAVLHFQAALLTPDWGFDVGLSNGLRIQLGPTVLLPEMVPIPAGTYQRGSNAPTGTPYFGGSAEQPVHQVTLSKPFWMGRFELTQAQYASLMGSIPSGMPASWQGPDRPVEQASWLEAVAYCEALNAHQSALGNVPPGYVYRLPTEAEWEYACRAGTTTEFHYGPALTCDQARISFSNHAVGSCGVSQDSAQQNSGTVVVGVYAPNAWGLHDMHGNVWEWCLDSYAPYTASPKTDPYVTVGSGPVLRGGSWGNTSNSSRSAKRFSATAINQGSIAVGFRVVLAPDLTALPVE
jgi:formylglycine-generating enzyme required for sulfatase activity